MFVLSDIEWITNAAGHYSPTQLAAIRVDGDWNETARFHSFIRPRDGEFHDWAHVAYSGGNPVDFLRARNAHNVLESFRDWLAEDDIVLWWYMVHFVARAVPFVAKSAPLANELTEAADEKEG